MDNFWTLLKKPIFALAPLSGITDSPFRRICKGLGADVVYSELTSCTALAYKPEASLRVVRFDESERPYVVQLFGNNPEHFATAAILVSREIKPDGIDINFGCPIPKVFKRGAGAALMTNLPLAKEVILSVIENTHLPVSIKTRTRVNEVDLLSFLDYVGDLDIKAIMVTADRMRRASRGLTTLKRPGPFAGVSEGLFLLTGEWAPRHRVWNYSARLVLTGWD